MSTPKKPRAADVARWVADIAAPRPCLWMVEDRKEWERNRRRAISQLSSWGLGHDGLPKSPGAEGGAS